MKYIKFTFIALFFFSSHLCAAKLNWGLTKEKHNFEGAHWEEVFFKDRDNTFTGSIPNFERTDIVEQDVSFSGSINNYLYSISAVFDSGKVPTSGKKFKQLVQKSHPNASIGWLDAKKLGVKYAVEFVDKKNIPTHYRVICTKSHFIMMSTTDANTVRRNHFFDSFGPKK